jgi:SAM-dependent methyltransferase
MNGNPPGTGFDAVASRYDDDERGNDVIAHVRERAFDVLRRAFSRGARLIEIGSGTGTEASRLARELDCRIALVDPSPSLLERASAKVRAVSDSALTGAHLLPARKLEELTAIYGANTFDGAYSSLGPLNCEGSLRPTARALADLIHSGGRVVLSVINRWCAFEVAWYALHGQLREARRRWGGPIQASAYAGGPKDVTTWYYSRRDIERAFAPEFRVRHAQALPLLWPPMYLDFLVRRHRGLFRALEPPERRVASMALLRDLGDHVLVVLERSP